MNLLEIIFDKSIKNKYKFGIFVRKRRNELGIGLIEFAKSVGLAPSYVSDIEKGFRQAPLNFLDEFAKILQIDKSQINYFHDIAGCSHSNWQDINDYLKDKPNARKFIRLARDKNLTDTQISQLINLLKKDTRSEDFVQ